MLPRRVIWIRASLNALRLTSERRDCFRMVGNPELSVDDSIQSFSAWIPNPPRIGAASLIRPVFFNQSFRIKAWPPSEQKLCCVPRQCEGRSLGRQQDYPAPNAVLHAEAQSDGRVPIHREKTLHLSTVIRG